MGLKETIALASREAVAKKIKCPCVWHKNGWVPKYIKIIEEFTGKTIPPGFVVHHKNGKRNDNRIENLTVIEYGLHKRLHKYRKKFIYKND